MRGQCIPCAHCGQAFYCQPNKRRFWCSKACKDAARNVTRVCPACGVSFSRALSDTAMHCSDACRRTSARTKKPDRTARCVACGNDFYCPPSRVTKGGKFCSHACRTAALTVTKVCRHCGEAFTTPRSRDHRQHFCGPTCHADYDAMLARQANHYRQVRVDGVTVGAHRAIMAERIGRPLRRDEHVHHRNHNKNDNRLENLQLMSAAEHMQMHAVERARANRGQWSRMGHSCCVGCGTTTIPHNAKGLCRVCYEKTRDRRPKTHGTSSASQGQESQAE